MENMNSKAYMICEIDKTATALNELFEMPGGTVFQCMTTTLFDLGDDDRVLVYPYALSIGTTPRDLESGDYVLVSTNKKIGFIFGGYRGLCQYIAHELNTLHEYNYIGDWKPTEKDPLFGMGPDIERKGPACVRDTQVLPRDFVEFFGDNVFKTEKNIGLIFSAVERYKPCELRQEYLKTAYETLYDLAKVLGVDAASLSLNGEVNGVFEYGRYNTQTIGLLADCRPIIIMEWANDLDAYLAKGLNVDYLSLVPTQKNGLMADVMKAIYEDPSGAPSDFYLSSIEADIGRIGNNDLNGYRFAPQLFARAFVAYVDYKMWTQNVYTAPTPNKTEIVRIAKAMDRFVEKLKDMGVLHAGKVDYDHKLKKELANSCYRASEGKDISENRLELLINAVKAKGLPDTYENCVREINEFCLLKSDEDTDEYEGLTDVCKSVEVKKHI